MSVTPYESFNDWEKDMARIRQHPNDAHLIKHVRGRVNASSEDIQRQVHQYLQDMAFSNNPIPIGKALAKHTNKYFFVRHPQDPWFYV